jgi:hypothetical protein
MRDFNNLETILLITRVEFCISNVFKLASLCLIYDTYKSNTCYVLHGLNNETDAACMLRKHAKTIEMISWIRGEQTYD